MLLNHNTFGTLIGDNKRIILGLLWKQNYITIPQLFFSTLPNCGSVGGSFRFLGPSLPAPSLSSHPSLVRPQFYWNSLSSPIPPDPGPNPSNTPQLGYRTSILSTKCVHSDPCQGNELHCTHWEMQGVADCLTQPTSTGGPEIHVGTLRLKVDQEHPPGMRSPVCTRIFSDPCVDRQMICSPI